MEWKFANCPKNISLCTFRKLEYVHLNDFYHRDYYFITDDWITWKPFTWEQASDLCEGVFYGHLPWFESKYSLLQFLSVLKLSRDVPVMEAIYIGLRFNTSEVSIHH